MSQHNCHINPNGKIKCWGSNSNGKLGLGDTVTRGDNPNEMGVNLPFVNVGNGLVIDQVSIGGQHTCIHSTSNQIKCWGRNTYGQLGLGVNDAMLGHTPLTTPNNLTFVNLGTVSYPTIVGCGGEFTCVLFNNNKVKCFGANDYGQIGYELVGAKGTSPNDMGDNLPFVNFGTNVQVQTLHTAGYSWHSCIIIVTSQLMKCWGLNNNYQLGYGDNTFRGFAGNSMGDFLQTIDLGTEDRVKTIGIGDSFTCALRIDDQLKCWGSNASGALGIGSTVATVSAMGTSLGSTPYDSTGKKIKQISGGGDEMCILLDDNLSAKCIGFSNLGQLGQGDKLKRGDTASTTLDKIPAINLGTGTLQISYFRLLFCSVCVVFVDNSVKCFGYAGFGTLGYGSTTDIGTNPSQMGASLPFVDVLSTFAPSRSPTLAPTNPTSSPTSKPSFPSQSPTIPTKTPTEKPTRSPIKRPTKSPTTASPTNHPTLRPTLLPSKVPSTQSPTSKCTQIDKFNWESNGGKDNILSDLDVCSKSTTCGNLLLQVGKEAEAKDCIDKCMSSSSEVKSKSYTELCLSCIVDFSTCQYALCDVCKSGRNKNLCRECTNISKCKDEFKSCTGILEISLSPLNDTIAPSTNDPVGAIVGSVLGVVGLIGLGLIIMYYRRVKKQEQNENYNKMFKDAENSAPTLSSSKKKHHTYSWRNYFTRQNSSIKNDQLIANMAKIDTNLVRTSNPNVQNANEQWINTDGIKFVALHPFAGENESELSIEKGQMLEGMSTNGVWHLVKDPVLNITGLVPCNHIKQV